MQPPEYSTLASSTLDNWGNKSKEVRLRKKKKKQLRKAEYLQNPKPSDITSRQGTF